MSHFGWPVSSGGRRLWLLDKLEATPWDSGQYFTCLGHFVNPFHVRRVAAKPKHLHQRAKASAGLLCHKAGAHKHSGRQETGG